MKTNTIKTFSYNGYTIDLFIDNSSIFYNYAITIFSMEKGTMYIHSAIDDIYKATNTLMDIIMDLLTDFHQDKRGLTKTSFFLLFLRLCPGPGVLSLALALA